MKSSNVATLDAKQRALNGLGTIKKQSCADPNYGSPELACARRVAKLIR